MDPKEFYSKKYALLIELADALMEANEVSMKIRGHEVRGAADPDSGLLYELRTLSKHLEDFEKYAADQVDALDGMLPPRSSAKFNSEEIG
jgi:hypothetical protein